jgi:hypothetical protein
LEHSLIIIITYYNMSNTFFVGTILFVQLWFWNTHEYTNIFTQDNFFHTSTQEFFQRCKTKRVRRQGLRALQWAMIAVAWPLEPGSLVFDGGFWTVDLTIKYRIGPLWLWLT